MRVQACIGRDHAIKGNQRGERERERQGDGLTRRDKANKHKEEESLKELAYSRWIIDY